MRDVSHRRVATNGVQLHVAEAGDGPLVVLCHGFPELWFSWRHQLPALAAGGYRALAPDMRGYGDSSAPPDPAEYAMPEVCADLVGLIDAVGEERAVFVGHDWGASVVWELARLHPDRVAAVVGISVPFVPRAPAPPTGLLRQALGEDFYVVWFQEPGVAEEALSRDVRRTIATREVWSPDWARRGDGTREPYPWMSEEELDVYVEAYERTGFTGGLNYYRALDRNWELSAEWADRHVTQPALYLVGSRDPVRTWMPDSLMEGWVDDLRGTVVMEGAGHWLQQECPDEVNRALLGFLEELPRAVAQRLGRALNP